MAFVKVAGLHGMICRPPILTLRSAMAAATLAIDGLPREVLGERRSDQLAEFVRESPVPFLRGLVSYFREDAIFGPWPKAPKWTKRWG